MPQAAGSSGPGSLEPSSTDVYQQTGNSVWKTYSQSDHYHALSDASLFSSSLPVLGHEKLNLNVKEREYKLFDDALDSLNIPHRDLEGNGIIEDGGNHVVGILLPDDEDELLAGIADGIDIGWLPNHVDNSEEYDLFGSGGGMELESDRQENVRIGISNLGLSNGSVSNGETHYHLSNGIGTISGEHPLGEHPSRTLFVRNINSNVEDMELRALFEGLCDDILL